MAITLKNLAAGLLNSTSDTKVYGYTTGAPSKTALVKNIILTNTHTSSPVTINAEIKPANGGTNYQLSPVEVSIPPKGQIVLDSEITLDLEQLDQIILKAGTASYIEYVLNGLERDK